MSADALTLLAGLLQTEGGLLADVVNDEPAPDRDRLGAVAAAGPRAAGKGDDYALLVEAIREGYLLHYGLAAGHGGPRVVRTDDADLGLLAGDRLYALGLERLAALGDLDAVAILADVISEGARLNAEGRPQDADRMWAEGAAAVGNGRKGRQ